MAQNKHVTSEAIVKLGKDLVDHAAPAFDPMTTNLEDADIEFPDFGLVGLPLNGAYNEVRDYALNYVKAGKQQLTTYQTQLNEIAKNWDKVEDANTFVIS